MFLKYKIMIVEDYRKREHPRYSKGAYVRISTHIQVERSTYLPYLRTTVPFRSSVVLYFFTLEEQST